MAIITTKTAAAPKAKPKIKTTPKTRRNTVKIDPIDLRDRPYMPNVYARPPVRLDPVCDLKVLNQKDTNACTGFALASVVHLLQTTNDIKDEVSPFMIYSMARRYDEFPGSVADEGSSIRGALKGWSRHGICHSKLWKTMKMPPVPARPQDDWWADAMCRPLGAYYRVNTQSISDMHVALNEVKILYASAVCHAGWDEGDDIKARADGDYWQIPIREVAETDGGHAFVIIGYTHEGFIIQNSWGKGWGTGGRAILRYEDWRENAMDCWVVQIGVPTALHQAIARSTSLRMSGAKVQLAQDTKLRNHELSPYIVNMENNGALSTSGDFRTTQDDVNALVTTYLQRAREQWGLQDDEPADIAIYAHGGLTNEKDAANGAASWIPALYEQKIFPIFFMWETGLVATLSNIVKEWFGVEPKKTSGIKTWWDERLERTLARPGTGIWSEMKENAKLIGAAAGGGGQILYNAAKAANGTFNHKRDRLHLIGHSAGGIVHCYLVDLLVNAGWRFDTVNFMAPAATVQLFDEKLRPHIVSGKVASYNQWHLSNPLELKDNTCRPILGYGRSLLYLVSQSFEGGTRTPILGMEKYHGEMAPLPNNAKAFASQGPESNSTTHGGFDNDAATIKSVLKQVTKARTAKARTAKAKKT